MSTKAAKTKKVGLVIEWPTTHFTTDDIQQKYPNVINITLRFRVKKAIENKELVTIGKIKPAIGRPRIVYARANPSAELLEAAKAAGVLPLDDKAALPVAEVKSAKAQKATTAPAPVSEPATVNTPAQ